MRALINGSKVIKRWQLAEITLTCIAKWQQELIIPVYAVDLRHLYHSRQLRRCCNPPPPPPLPPPRRGPPLRLLGTHCQTLTFRWEASLWTNKNKRLINILMKCICIIALISASLITQQLATPKLKCIVLMLYGERKKKRETECCMNTHNV